MKQPEQIYKKDHTAENVKIIEDYTAESVYITFKNIVSITLIVLVVHSLIDTANVTSHKTNNPMNGG